MSPLPIPKNLEELVDRIAALEARVVSNDQRITSLEHDRVGPLAEQLAEHQAAAATRLEQIHTLEHQLADHQAVLESALAKRRWQQMRPGRR